MTQDFEHASKAGSTASAARTDAIPHWETEPDYFVWTAFDTASRDPARFLERDSTQQEALLAESAGCYVVPDQFGVRDGHVLILPKRSVSSIAALDPQLDDEVRWVIHHVERLVAQAYDAHVVVGEHGECGSASIPQAHIHVLPIPASVDGERMRRIVEEVSSQRVSHTDVSLPDRGLDYPPAARALVERGRPYVYFAGPDTALLQTHDVQRQFVRQVASVANNLGRGVWDRHVNRSRENMFATFSTLAPVLARSGLSDFGFTPRAGG